MYSFTLNKEENRETMHSIDVFVLLSSLQFDVVTLL